MSNRELSFANKVPTRFTTRYPTKKTLQLISTFSPFVTAQHTTCSNTRLVLLKMDIMMPETCWEIIDNKHLTVASFWFSLTLHNLPTIYGHRNLNLYSKFSWNFLQLSPIFFNGPFRVVMSFWIHVQHADTCHWQPNWLTQYKRVLLDNLVILT